MLRDISLRQVVIILTLFLGTVNACSLVVLVSLSDWPGVSILWWLGILTFSLILSFIFIRFFLDFFVLRKLKLIYRMIGDSRQIRSLRGMETQNEEAIDGVAEEVMKWTEKRETEIEHLHRLEQYRRNFVGNLSHELKTPLFSVQGYIHTLLEGGLYDDVINIKYLKRAATNLDRLGYIVDDLEKINHLETGAVVLNLEQFDLKELVKEVNEDLDFMAKDAQTKISIKPGANQSFKVSADREKIRQVLQNLVSNALKYGREEGNVTVGFYSLEDKVLVEIEDDGDGIEEKHLNHLFDRFYRVDSGRSRKHGGSGLGLAIVKHILEAHHQTVSVRSTIGEGTTFGFTLDKAK